MPKLLEVIVTSAQEAIEAERGGADRLELVRSLEHGGLTPELEVAADVLKVVSIPVRIMLRENASMSIGGAEELSLLQACASSFAKLAIDGFVLGFVRHGVVDVASTEALLAAAPAHPATFHRAFDHAGNPLRAVEDLKRFRRIDRILTTGGHGSEAGRIARLVEWQTAAAPEIKILAAAGLAPSFLNRLKQEPGLPEIHVGRAARLPQTISGRISRHSIAALKLA